MKRILVIALIISIIWGIRNCSGKVTLGPGVMVNDVPVQEEIKSPISFNHLGFKITKVANFKIKAKVLAREDYYFDRGADLAPVDLALGWGRMSDESILEQINITQSGRFYRWRVKSFPIPRREIETHSANMHLIPADKYVQYLIDDIREGEIIELTGSLVNVQSKEGWYWNSSLTRNDTGNGACELIWVESLSVLK
ncbi:hypothetical protein CW740_00255 [Kangiella profundi]|uniref:Uncharacterized protein n=1 Tax=Kangiella profundi TaxID=1561924 RepID=A0A2K9AV10_9GAMM|nr:hypothetical protein [Kangiella profundi]AUD77749.1 hypothetical protein CW740_00255 [Kangiella profundi]